MIKTVDLSRKYGDQFAVQNLSFEVKRGEVMGLLGPNGAGKSTTMKMLTCFLPPSSGDAMIDGISLAQSLEVRRKVGYLPEHAPSYHDLDVNAYLEFTAKMHGLPRGTMTDRIHEMTEACGLQQARYRRIEELSKGYRQRVGLAASMLHNPECLILDEPTTGLDPNQIVEIRHLIRRLAEQKTVLLSSHILPEVEAVCDRMMIIDQGQVQALGTASELAAEAKGSLRLHVIIKEKSAAVIARLQQELPELQVKLVEEQADGQMAVELSHEDVTCPLAEKVFSAAVAENAVLLEMRNERVTLEDVFRKLTGGEQ